MRVRIVVADESEARFYEVEGFDEQLQHVGTLTNSSARLHDRDLKSDRPGRVFDRAPSGGERRGGVAHHATGGERTPRRHEVEIFARQIAQEIEKALQQGQFDRLILMAAPGFLGELRGALPPAARASVAAEVHKDLIHQQETAVREHLPREAFGVRL